MHFCSAPSNARVPRKSPSLGITYNKSPPSNLNRNRAATTTTRAEELRAFRDDKFVPNDVLDEMHFSCLPSAT